MNSKFKVFYSWQSDLDKSTNLNAIRSCLRIVANEFEEKDEEILMEIDEATRGLSGSPNIPLSIFSKIENSDIFICDLTTINSSDESKNRKTPNPNVLIELGFAIAKLGWERIIMLFNKKFGDFPKDLPFDIDRHRASSYLIESKKDKEGKANLTVLLTVAIESIFKSAPKKPDELKNIKPKEIKRQNDIKYLKEALSQIHLPTFDKFIEDYPDLIIREIFDYKNDFLNIVYKKDFYIYNLELKKLLDEFWDLWIKSLSYSVHYYGDRNNRGYKFYFPDLHSEQYENSYKVFHEMVNIGLNLNKSFSSLLTYVREEYLEINLEEVSNSAFKVIND
tara:strand:+ start:93 stop:1097 length:1005 start_codon:yes stop_codon:yes gene_type:complete